MFGNLLDRCLKLKQGKALSQYEELAKKCEDLIRTGRAGEVPALLRRLELQKVPRQWRLPLANLGRRAGAPKFGLALLGSLVRKEKRGGKAPATPAELAEYGVLLLRYGATNEAERHLLSVDLNEAPSAALFLAYTHFLRWDFVAAVPLLERYLASPLSPYARLVGQTNLGYALVEAGRHGEATQLLDAVIERSRSEGHRLLETNCRAYKAQSFFQEQDLTNAQREIDAAKTQFTTARANDHFLIDKWDLILEGFRDKSQAPFQRLRKSAFELRDWAGLREADFYELKIKFDLEKFLHLYFGSPMPRFREHLQVWLGFVVDREVYVLGAKDSPRFDLRTGLTDRSTIDAPTPKSHQLIEVLLRDFYQPLRIASLFSGLHPEEFFDIYTSPDRVQKVLRRTRAWFTQWQVPLKIPVNHGFYSLQTTGPFSFRVPLNRETPNLLQTQFQTLLHSLDKATFTAREARQRLNWPKTTMRRVLDWGIANGRLRAEGPSARLAIYVLQRDTPILPKVVLNSKTAA
jgi:hypothetical protein